MERDGWREIDGERWMERDEWREMDGDEMDGDEMEMDGEKIYVDLSC